MKVARSVIAAIGAGGALVTSAATCSFYDESMLLPARLDGAPLADAGEDVALADTATPDPCPHAEPVTRPSTPDSEPSLPSLVMAVRTLTYSDSPDGGAKLGVDLDNTCTCQLDAPPTCAPRAGGKGVCDDTEGRDNGLGGLLQRLGNLSPAFRELSLTQQLEEGDRALLFELRNWNGTPNDPSVVLAFYASNGIGSTDAGRLRPKWDGTDRFTLAPESLRGGKLIGGEPFPIYFDDRGYVRDGVVVGRPVSTEPFSGVIGIPLQITSGLVFGRLVPIGGGWGLTEGQLVGRTSTRSVLTALATLRDPFDGTKFLCGSNGNYQGVRTLICQGADLRIDPGAKDPSEACDALGTAFGVTAWPARFGAVEAIPRPEAGCDAGYTDDCPP